PPLVGARRRLGGRVALILALLGAAAAQDYAFPTSAEDYGHFYPTAYYDHGGVTDWACDDLTYGGHTGSDFGGGSWSGMEAGRDITAAAAGTVVATNDGVADDCSTGDCEGGGGLGNYVKIQHPDGRQTWYGHLKTWSVIVANGQYVGCGQKLGEMGSSGYSTGPHVHFTATNTSGSRVDPFDGACSGPPSYWVDQGAWNGLPSPICADVAACAQVDRLSCGETIATANDAGGATSTHMAYGCGDYTYSGPEIAYAFSTELTEAVTVTLSGNGADVDLFVLGSDACDGSGAVGCSVSPDAEGESVSFTATAGVVYTVVADGYEGATTGFSLSAACAGAWPGEGGTDTSPPVDTAPAPDTAAPDSAPPEPREERVRPPPGTWARLDTLGCGGSAAGALVAVGLLGARRRRR
ncbi:MAG: peptidoglycan DD-metalloendopeptidase family protein, partial [Myxococcota bacterium]